MAMVTTIVLIPVPEAMNVAVVLTGIIGVFVGGETYIKKYLDPNSAYRGEN